MNAKFFISVLSVFILLASAAYAPAQNILLFTFGDSGPNVTATVTGSFDTSGMSFVRQKSPELPGMFPFHGSTGFFWGTTTATNVDVFEGATATGSGDGFALLFNFFPGEVDTPLSEYFEIDASNHDGFSSIALAEGETVFNADTLANNVLVFEATDLDDFGRPFTIGSSFLNTNPTTVLSDPNGENIIQFVLAEVLLGDVSRDGVVNFGDIGPFIEVLIEGGDLASNYVAQADCNRDGVVDFFDISVFISILSAS